MVINFQIYKVLLGDRGKKKTGRKHTLKDKPSDMYLPNVRQSHDCKSNDLTAILEKWKKSSNITI